ncbi:MAG: TonB-dependent receptor [Bacteroidia bacterium]
MKHILVYIYLFLFYCASFAQSGNCYIQLKGRVLDSSDQMPLSHTSIATLGVKTTETITDKDGYFVLKNLCPDSVEFHITHFDYDHLHIHLVLNKDTSIIIYLKHSTTDFSGIKLSVKQEKKESINQLNKADIDRTKGLSISEVMSEIPGVSLQKTGSTISKPVINGLQGNRVLIVNNGIRQEGQNWGAEHAPEIDAFLATQIRLLKTVEALRYGADGIAGVLLVGPLSIFSYKEHMLYGEVNSAASSNGRAGILNAMLGGKTNIGFPLYWRVQGTLKQSGNVKTSRDFLANTGTKENNYSLNLGMQQGKLLSEVFYSEFHTQIGLYLGSQVGNITDLQTAIQSSRPLIQSDFVYGVNRPFQSVVHRLIKIKNEYRVNARNKLELTLSLQKNHREEYDVLRSATSFSGPSFDYYINTNMGELLWSRNDYHNIRFKTGLFGLRQSNAYSGRFFIPGFFQNSIAPFFLASKNYKNLHLEAGLRYDVKQYEYYLWKNNNLNVNNLNYKGLAYQVNVDYTMQHHSLGLAVSSTWRPPGPNELYANGLHQGIASFEKGDSGLRLERSYSQSLNYVYSYRKFKIESEWFYQYINGFINLIPSKTFALTVRGAYPIFVYKQTNAELYGMRFKTSYEFNKHFATGLEYNFLYGNDLTNKTPLQQMPPFNGTFKITYTRKNIETTLRVQHTAEQTRYVAESDFLAPPPAYTLFGLDLKWNTRINKQDIQIALNIDNLGNQAYRNYLNRFRYFTDEQGINFRFHIQIPINIQLKK